MIIIKLGGAAGINPQPLLQELAHHPEPWILVHGGNEQLDQLTRQLGHEPNYITSPTGHISRHTTPQTIDHIRMIYRGRINHDLVTRLQNLGVNAVGLSGTDGRILQAARKTAIRSHENGITRIIRDDQTGKIHTVDPTLLRLLLDHGYRPVITIPAHADTGEAVNVDGDRAAAAIAAALGAHTLLNLSNVPGLLRDPNDPTTLIHRIPRNNLQQADQYARGRYRKKIMAAQEALDAGVPQIILATASAAQPIQNALTGNGTVIA